MKNVVCCFLFFLPVCSVYYVLSLEYRALRIMKSLYLLYYCIVPSRQVFWYLGR